MDYYRLHKFEDLKKVRKEVRDISDERKRFLLEKIQEEEGKGQKQTASRRKEKKYQEVLQFEKQEMLNPKAPKITTIDNGQVT